MLPFFIILTVAMRAIAAGLDVYRRKFASDTATINRAQFVVECLRATIDRKPLPLKGI